MSIIIPQELLELFIDELSPKSNEDRRALCNCLLVSRIFFLRSRSRLFAHLELTIDHIHKERWKTFRDLLEFYDRDNESGRLNVTFSSLKFCVKSLRVKVQRFLGSDDIYVILSFLAGTHLLRYVSLNNFSLSGLDGAIEFNSAIRSICKSRSLEQLELNEVKAVPVELIDFWKLKRLVFSHIWFADDFPDACETTSGNVQPNQCHPHLQFFAFAPRYKPPPPEKWFQDLSPFSQLHTLVFRLDEETSIRNSFLLNRLLAISSSTLHTLHLQIGDTTPLQEAYPHTLQHLTALRVLKFAIISNSEGDPHWEHYDQDFMRFERTADVVESLRTVNQMGVLTALSLIAVKFVGVTWDWETEVVFEPQTDWHTLGDLLSQPQFATVDRVEVSLGWLDRSPLKSTSPVPTFLERIPRIWNARHPGIPMTADDPRMYPQDNIFF